MLNRRIPTPEELAAFNEKLYKMYDYKNRSDYEGSIIKRECTINNERGIFKERMSMQSKDHIMEQVAYEIAKVLNLPCCKASCRKVEGIYGSFSRYEVPDIENIITFSTITGKIDMQSDEIIDYTLRLCKGVNNFVIRLYQYIIFDFILGQLDRHLDNLSVYRHNRGLSWYPLYDNGLCCFSAFGTDSAILHLNNGFYSSRMGTDTDILESLRRYRKAIYPNDLRTLIPYNKLTGDVLYNIIDKSDKYNQLCEGRRKATIEFVHKQIKDIHKLNIGG